MYGVHERTQRRMQHELVLQRSSQHVKYEVQRVLVDTQVSIVQYNITYASEKRLKEEKKGEKEPRGVSQKIHPTHHQAF